MWRKLSSLPRRQSGRLLRRKIEHRKAEKAHRERSTTTHVAMDRNFGDSASGVVVEGGFGEPGIVRDIASANTVIAS
jgi:hypothetical protein